jgi:hypothetical protein
MKVKNVTGSIVSIRRIDADGSGYLRSLNIPPAGEVLLYDAFALQSVELQSLLNSGKLSIISSDQPANAPAGGDDFPGVTIDPTAPVPGQVLTAASASLASWAADNDVKLTGAQTVAGAKTLTDTLVCYKDNASSFRLRGPQFGGGDVQSYSGMFYNNAYDTIGTLKTRAIFGANLEMDLELQSPHALLLSAIDNTQADGVIKARSRTAVEISSRCDAEVDAPKKLSIDRVNTGVTGAANTSDVEMKTSSGPLHINDSNSGGAVIGGTLILDGCTISISGDDVVFTKGGKTATLTMV